MHIYSSFLGLIFEIIFKNIDLIKIYIKNYKYVHIYIYQTISNLGLRQFSSLIKVKNKILKTKYIYVYSRFLKSIEKIKIIISKNISH